MSLLERLRDPGDAEAWKRFVHLYAPLVFHWGRRRGLDAADSADLVQEVMATLVRALPDFRYDSGGRFRGWLRTLTINKATDLHRQNKASSARTNVAELDGPTEPSAADLFEEEEYRRYLVRRAFDLVHSDIDEVTWTACRLQVMEGKKAADAARELGITINSAYLAKSRVLARLRKELEGFLE